ncbi:MAG: hypothetical protein M1838_001630 [Thelocarpon superellum]|nr:MAG: hypothetical protein M1838_001630 [Thelocarpon superellum]
MHDDAAAVPRAPCPGSLAGPPLAGLGKTRQGCCYDADILDLRRHEYPQLNDTTYLDHAGTTLVAKATMEHFSLDMTANLFGNPHSGAPSSQLSTRRVEDTRLQVLRFLHADPEFFDVVFVANATAGVKLVMDALRDAGDSPRPPHRETKIEHQGFWYGYHQDCHTSLVGVREVARGGHRCFTSDADVDAWLAGRESCRWGHDDFSGSFGLFAYPAQSNLDGRRLPLTWPHRLRQSSPSDQPRLYSLLDAAAYATTAPLDLSQPDQAADFTVLSFYKIFGFPDLGALIVRKASGHLLRRRKYFGGGTVEMVSCVEEAWHVWKSRALHEVLEDGTPPFHSIIALQAALRNHRRLYGSMENIGCHTAHLSVTLFEGLSSLKHVNGRRICTIYNDSSSAFGDRQTQGPILAFNLQSSDGAWVGSSLVAKLASVKKIEFRTGTMCNPGGIASCLSLSVGEMKQNLAAGYRCGDDHDVMGGKPTGVIRVSLGAMSAEEDVTRLIDFVREFFTERDVPIPPCLRSHEVTDPVATRFHVEALTVYPVKSCAGWKVPRQVPWKVCPEGLAFDREWCLVHRGTGNALSQKQYPKMSLLRPIVDLEKEVLRSDMSSRLQSSIPILLSNESPVLIISRSSVNRLNEQIKLAGGKAAQAEVFRSNIIVAEMNHLRPGGEQPYAEDNWSAVKVGQQYFELLGPCRRCHMVCIDQATAERDQEPFVTLSKTRRKDGKVYFGQHSRHRPDWFEDEREGEGERRAEGAEGGGATIMVGDPVMIIRDHDDTGALPP